LLTGRGLRRSGRRVTRVRAHGSPVVLPVQTASGMVRSVLEIKIDREVCMGSGNCSFWAPGVFDLDDDGIAIVVDPAGAPEDKIVLAAQGCPTQAIAILRDGEKIV
jgi:ferredoxin